MAAPVKVRQDGGAAAVFGGGPPAFLFRGNLMAFAMHCTCGQRLEVTEGMASTSVPCPCGRTLAVPSLGELRRLYPQTEEPDDLSERSQVIARVIVFVLSAIVLGSLALVIGMVAVNGGGLSLVGYGVFL